MASNKQIQVDIKIGADISTLQSQLQKIQSEFNKLDVGSGMTKEVESAFKKVEDELNTISKLSKNDQLNLVDKKQIENTFDKLGKDWEELINKLNNKKVSSSVLKDEKSALERLKQLQEDYNKAIAGGTDKIKKANEKYAQQKQLVDSNQKQLAKLVKEQQELTTKQSGVDAARQAAKNELDELKKQNAEIVQRGEYAKQNLQIERDKLEVIRKQFTEQYKQEHGGSDKGVVEARLAATTEQVEKIQQMEQDLQAYDNLVSGHEANIKKLGQTYDGYTTKLANNTAEQQKLNTELQTQQKTLSGLKGTITKYSKQEFEGLKQNLDWNVLGQAGIQPQDIQTVKQLGDVIQKLATTQSPQAAAAIQNITNTVNAAKPAMQNMSAGINQASQSLDQMSEKSKELDQLRNRITYFFSIGNAVRLFRRAIRSAMDTVKDLDKVMTETAVVTEFSVGGMWSQLPEYTKRANELGVSIHDVYEASTLYYQQGLKTNEVMQITNSTLRMARIAGLEAAEATDRMTNALRGFNMEINETNADNIADVYSKLAAISASNVDEISTAMTKVASLANSANMSFENTAAFLSQIIETTRESAETAGTALKTVVARFSEVKDLYSKGELLGETDEGEEVNVNKVSKALRTAGINLNEFLVGNKGLDEIFIELASKWDSLDIVQQRYIATMAAGSRQQSRFIALMSDYKRTLELTSAAEDANGASLEQYNKTLESIETKTARLKNAWDQFLMSITNSSIIKGAIDMLTGLVNILNKITDFFGGKSGILKSLTSITMTVGGLKLGKTLFNSLFGNPMTGVKGWMGSVFSQMKADAPIMTKQGAFYGTSFFKGFSDISQQGFKNSLKGMFGKQNFTATQLGISEIDFSDTRLNFQGLTIPPGVQKSMASQLANVDISAYTSAQQEMFKSLGANLAKGDFAAAQQQARELGIQLKMTGEETEKCGVKFKATGASVQAMSTMFAAAGGILLTVGSIIEKLTGKQTLFTRSVKYLGVALMTIPAILKVVEGAVRIFAVNTTAAISSIPIIGWIAAAITALTALGIAIAQSVDTQKKKAARASEALEALQQEVSNTKNAFEELSNGLDSIEEHTTTLEKLAKGTSAWKEEVQLTNQEVLDLITKYKELQVVSKNGVLTITNADEVNKQYEDMVKHMQQQENAATYRLLKEQFELDTKFTNKNNGSNGELQRVVDEVNAGTITSYEDLQNALYSYENQNENAYQTSEVAQYAESDEAFAKLLDLVKQVNTFNSQTESFYVQIGNAAVEMAGLTEEEKKYSDALVNNTDMIEHLTDPTQTGTYGWIGSAKNLKGLYEHYSSDEDRKAEEERYKNYIVKTFGVNKSEIKGTGEFKKGDKTYTVEDVAQGYQAYRIQEEIAPTIKTISETLNKLSKDETNSGRTGRIIADAFQDATGGELDLSEIMTLIGESTDQWREFASFTPEQLKENLKDRLSEIYQFYGGEAALGPVENFKNTLIESLVSGLNNYKNAMNFTNQSLVDDLGKFKSDVAKQFSDTINKFGGKNATDFGTAILTQFKAMGLAGNKLERAVEQFSLLNLSSVDDINSFNESLEMLGIEVSEDQIDEFVNYVINTVGALNTINLTGFKDQVHDVNKLLLETQNGEHKKEFTQEEYDLIKAYGGDTSQFLQTDKDKYIFTGSNMGAISNQMLNYLSGALSDTMTSLEKKIDIGNALDKADEEAKLYAQKLEERDNQTREWLTQQASSAALIAFDEQVEQRTKNNNRLIKQQRVQAIKDYYGEDSLDFLQKPEIKQEVSEMSDEVLDNILNWANDTLDSIPDLLEELKTSPKLQRSLDGMHNIADTFGGEGQDLTTDIQAMVDLIQNSNISDTFKEQYIMALNDPALTEGIRKLYAQQAATMADIFNDATYWSVDSELLNSMTEEYANIYELGADQAAKLALENINLNTGLEAIVSSYNNWNELLKKGLDDETIRSTKEYQEVIAELEKNIRQMFSIKGNLSSAFMNDKETQQLLESAATGDLEAITKLGRNAAQDIRKQFKFSAKDRNDKKRDAWDAMYAMTGKVVKLEPEITEESFTTIENQLFDFIDQLDPNIEITSQLNGETWNNARQGMIDQMNAMLEAGDITAQQMQDYFSSIGFVPDVEYETSTVTSHMYGYYPRLKADGDVDVIEYEYDAKQDIKVPKITDLHYKGPQGNFVSPKIQDTMANNAQPKSSGSSSKPKQWKNPYDELYNKQQEINTALRERERLEHKYQDMLEDHTKTSEDLVKNNLAQIASLKRQIQLQSQLLKGRQRQLTNIANETYEDSEGNRTTYAAMGVMRYVTYDEETREIHIDWNELNKVTDENLGGAIEAYVSRLEELLDAQNEIEDTIEELNDTVDEINKRGREEYLDFEQSVYDAIVGEREAEIEALENVSQTIKDAADKTIQSVQDEIDKERQLRENEKEEQSILDKQMRLAYLRRDTSGANALEIKKLEEELANDTQSYQDKIIDQTLQQMQDDAAKAAEQREEQINFLRDSLELDKATGKIWGRVEGLLNKGIDEHGIKSNSELDKILRQNGEASNMSKFGLKNWERLMAEEVAKAMQGRRSWELDTAKESGKLTLGDKNGTVLRYNPQKGTWYNTRTGESYTDDDLEYDYSQGKMVLKTKTSTQNQQQQQPGNTAKQSQDSKTQEPQYKNYTVQTGDSPWSIAEKQLGSGSRYTEIMQLNGLQPGQYIYTGQILKLPKYAQGGLVDTTGPAWLDGSKSRPEMVLDAADTRNLITLKNILASILNNAQSANKNSAYGDTYFDIDIQAEIDSDYDVDQLADRIKKQIYDDASYRNVNVISTMR